MKHLAKSVNIMLIALMLIFYSCEKEDISVGEDSSFTRIERTLIETTGTFNVSSSSDFTSNLTLEAGYNRGIITLRQVQGTSISGEFEIELNDNALQLVTLLDGEESIGYSLVQPGVNSSTFTLDDRTTIIASLLMHPLFLTSEEYSIDEVSSLIQSLPEFESTLEEYMSNDPLNRIESLVSSASFESLTLSFFDVLFQSQSAAQDGVEVYEVINARFAFNVINRRKRWLSIYAKLKPSGGSEYLDKKVILNSENEEQDFYLLESPAGDYGLFSELLAEIETPNPLVVTESETYSELIVTCYGPGIIEGDFTQEDYERMTIPAAHWLFFDMIVPLSELVVGIEKGKLRAELRGRPRNEKILEAIRRLTIQFLQPDNAILISNAARSDDGARLFFALMKPLKDFLLEPDNARLIKNIIKDVFIDVDAIDLVRNQLNIIRRFDNLLIAGNISNAFLSTVFSSAKIEFPFESEEQPGLFKIFDPLQQNFSYYNDVAVSDDGQTVWWTGGGADLYRWDSNNDVMIVAPIFDQIKNDLGFTIIPLAIDIHPTTNNLFLVVRRLNIATSLSDDILIEVNGDNSYDVLLENFFSIPVGFTRGIQFDPFGNLWISHRENEEANLSLAVYRDDGTTDKFENYSSSYPDPVFTENGLPLVTNFHRGVDEVVGELNALGELDTLTDFDFSYERNYELFFQSRDSKIWYGANNLFFIGNQGQTIATVGCVNPGTSETILFERFDGELISSGAIFRPFEAVKEDSEGRIWLGGGAIKNSIILYRNGTMNVITGNDSNLPISDNPDFPSTVGDIDTDINGKTWFVFGGKLLRFGD